MDIANKLRLAIAGASVAILAACGGGGGAPGGAATRHVLTVATAGTGSGAVTSSPAGINCGASCAGSFDDGTSVTLTAIAANGSVFGSWSGACTGSAAQVVVTVDAAKTCTASFAALRSLGVSLTGAGSGTVTGNPAGIACGNTCSASHVDGTSVVLTAAPAGGSAFVQWGGDCAGTAATATVVLTAPHACTAQFEPLYTLSVTKTGTGNGVVTSALAAIDCGNTCSAQAVAGTTITLTAAPAAGSNFVAWAGDCGGNATTVDVTLTGARTCTARFDVVPPGTQQFVLTVSKLGAGTGNVSSLPTGIDCGVACTASFNTGTVVSMTATAAAGSGFVGWGGDCNGTGATASVTLTAVRACTATFAGLPAAPTLQLAYALKRFDFSWVAVNDATHYRLFEQAGAGAAFTQVGGDLTATSASKDISVHRIDWLAIAYKLQACNSVGCTDSAVVSASAGMLPTIGYVKASNTGVSDLFGYAIALSADGNTLAVGAYDEDSNASGINGDQGNNSANRAGAVYVFARVSGTWTQQAYIKGSTTSAGDSFGWSVALSADGTTLAVGAVDDDPAGGFPSGGSVYVFTRTGAAWSEQAALPATAAVGARLGWSVALSANGDTLAAGAPNGGAGSYVNLYTRTVSTWSKQATLTASNAGATDLFGSAVTLAADGNTLAVGAPNEASNATGINGDQTNNLSPGAGAVYLFTRGAGIWSQQVYMKASNTGFGDQFGSAVSLSSDGTLLAVGAPNENSNATGIGGDQTNNTASGSGACYLFAHSGSTWSQSDYVKASLRSGRFGDAVAFSADGNSFVVGATVDASAGAAFVFVRSNGSWRQQAYLKPPNVSPSDRFGSGVAISADGATIAVAADSEDGAATGIGGDWNSEGAGNSGAVYLY
jgi:hypothetical protein